MESFKHRNKEILFWSKTGEVLSQNKYSSTHVSSEGGGGYVGQHGGHVSAPKITSTTTTHHEFWIKKEDGSEECIKLVDCDIPVREGQRITLISAGIKGKNATYYSVLVNHNAYEHWYIKEADSLNKVLDIDTVSGKFFFIAIALWGVVTQIADNFVGPGAAGDNMAVGIGAAVAGAFVIFRLATKIPRISKMTIALDQHLKSLIQAAYQNN